MDRNEAASVIRKYLTCTDITHSCNGKCKACRYHTNDDEKELALRLAIKALEGKDTNVPTKWIPFKTRPLTEEEKEEYPDCNSILDCELPEDGQEILVTIKNRNHEPVQYDEFYTDDGCYLDSGYEIGTEATAWMPLPQPYKEG